MKGVQLIAFDTNKNPYIPKDSLTVLQSLTTTSLHVISVAGKYRTGKSYILNRVLLNKSQGFSVGHTINACTKGLWMWPELIRLQGKDCLIIDTEGLGSLEEGESTDLKIFLLALLFSSQLVYNSVGSIDEQAIESLSLVIQLATLLQRQDRYDTQELVNTFPSFLWLLRDFSLKLENEKGLPITPQEYLEHALKHQSRTSPAAERKNQIRKQLRTFFQERDCFALVRPTEEERDLQNLSSVADCKLRPEFVSLVGALRRRLGERVRPKRVRGKALGMEGFIELCQYYTKALGDGRLPSISSHWDNLCLSETHRISQKFQLEHLKALESLPSHQVPTAHSQIVKEGLEAIDRSFLGRLEKQLFKERFERKLEGQLQEWRQRVSWARTREVREALESLQEATGSEDPLARYEAVSLKMSEMSQSSSQHDALYCELYLYLSEFARHLLEESTTRGLQQQRVASEKLGSLQGQLVEARRQAEQERLHHETEITQLRKQFNESRQRLASEDSYSQRQQAELNGVRSTVRELTTRLREAEDRLQASKAEEMRLRQGEGELKARVKALQERVFELERELVEKESLVALQAIKSRKMLREKEVIRQRYQENLEDNLSLNNTIDQLHATISQLEQQRLSPTIHPPDLRQLTNSLRLAQEQGRILGRLCEEQAAALQALAQAPQNLTYIALKRSLEIEREANAVLKRRVEKCVSVLSNCQSFTCAHCHACLSPSYASEHFERCSAEIIEFDVSYSYDPNGAIQFDITTTKGIRQRVSHHSVGEARSFVLEMEGKQHEGSGEEEWEGLRAHLNQILESNSAQVEANPCLACFLGVGGDFNAVY